MTEWAPRQAKQEELKQIEHCLVLQPEATTFYLERARLLTELGMREEARDAYLQLLAKDPMNFTAMNNLGTLLLSMGFRSAARTAYEAVTQHWSQPTAHVNLGNLLREDRNFDAARKHYETALRLTSAERAKAHQGLAYIMSELGDFEEAEKHRRLGFQDESLVVLPYRGKAEPIPVIVLISAMGGNVPTHSFLDDRTFLMSIIVAEFFDPARPLPDHQLVFNAIGDVEICEDALIAAQKIIAKTTAPVINRPEAVMLTSRASNAERLKNIPGLIAPKIMTLARVDITPDMLTRYGFVFPILLRRPGFHAGEHFLKSDNADELAANLDLILGKELTVIQYVDVRHADGKIRKYRTMMIGGELYPLHAAVSATIWKLHFFSADMKDSPENCAGDAEFLEDMPKVIGARAIAALKQIQNTLGLDYAGIDFGLNRNGDVVLFETNATMVVNPPEHDEQWNYRRPPVKRILDAVRNMIFKKLPPALSKIYAQSA